MIQNQKMKRQKKKKTIYIKKRTSQQIENKFNNIKLRIK